MIELLDDFYHVQKACELFQTYPGDRFLVRGISCIVGENIDYVRLLSFASILFTSGLLLKIFGLFKEKYKWHYFMLLGLHPMVLFPFFYASQFATSVSVLWASIGLYLTQRYSKWNFLVLILWGFLGPLTRFESAYIFLMLWCSYNLMLFIKTDNIDKFTNRLLTHIKKINWTNLIILLIAFKTGGVAIKYMLPGVIDEKVFIDNIAKMYPSKEYYLSQIWAIILYFKNAIFPFSHTFFGNWYAWKDVTQGFGPIILISAYIITLMVSGTLTFIKTKYGKNLQITAGGMFIFILISTGFSIAIRSDWYYPSRQYLATLIILCFLAQILNRIKKSKLTWALILYFSTSTFYSVFYQYSDHDRFYNHEKLFSTKLHPILILNRANEYLSQGKLDMAEIGYHIVYRNIPPEMYLTSHRAAIFWLMSLYGGYQINELRNNKEDSFKILQILVRGTYFISTHACLQDVRIPIDECFSKDRVENFCAYYYRLDFPKQMQVHPYRIDVKQYCDQLSNR